MSFATPATNPCHRPQQNQRANFTLNMPEDVHGQHYSEVQGEYFAATTQHLRSMLRKSG